MASFSVYPMAQVENSMSTALHHGSTSHDQLPIQHPSPLPYKSSVLRYQSLIQTGAPHAPHSSNVTKSHHHNLHSSQPSRTADIPYPESYLRTPIYALPFPHPKWHIKAGTGEVYEVTSPIWEEYDAEVGYVNSVGEVKESVEGSEGAEGLEGKSQKGARRTTKRRLDSIDKTDGENAKRKRLRDA